MKITKYNHSCFLLEKDGRGLLFDPVEYTDHLPAITNLDAIIITHVHRDHFQPEILNKARASNPDVAIFATEDNAELKDIATIPKNGDKVSTGVFNLEFYGGDHAEIIPGQFVCKNLGTVVNGVFANSGDSFDAPSIQPEILLAPITAPWLRLSATKTFIETVKPRIVIPTHDALNSELGNTVCDNWLTKICNDIEAEYRDTHFGELA